MISWGRSRSTPSKAVITFVVLAMGRGIWAFFSYRRSPVAASMRRAAAAEGFGSADAEEEKLLRFQVSNNRAESRSPNGVIGPQSQDTVEISTTTVRDATWCSHVERA